ncbi:ABC transporter permease [Demequina aestuarii]|uniref:ABC transporter permease n=1 Tax=Demequina aestuarii TaxID=327095 RepID=UPI000A02CE12|nr:ABC transporter permease [Demequina aestuarii]
MSLPSPHDEPPSDAGGAVGAAHAPATPDNGGHRAGSNAAAWRSFLTRRGLGLIVNILLLVLATFFIVQLIPGDPATAIAGENATLEQVEQVRTELGLDRPMWDQLTSYIGGVAQGDFGDSFRYGLPALELVLTAAPYTLAIAGVAVSLVLVVGVTLGMAVGIATRGDRNAWLDRSFTAVMSVMQSIPPYLQATMLVLIFAVWLAVLPPAYSLAYGTVESALLPIAALSFGGIASVSRIVRRETAVTQEMDYMRTARGWRLPALRRFAKHLVPNLLTTTLTLSGIILTSMLGSAIIVETVFAWPGLGTTVIQAIAIDKDYPVIQAAVFFIGAISIFITFVIDVILGIIDPRTLGGQHD